MLRFLISAGWGAGLFFPRFAQQADAVLRRQGESLVSRFDGDACISRPEELEEWYKGK